MKRFAQIIVAVSYKHLDVYKRQLVDRRGHLGPNPCNGVDDDEVKITGF